MPTEIVYQQLFKLSQNYSKLYKIVYNRFMVRKDQIEAEVLRLRALGIPAVRIANDLGIHRNTVGNIVKRTTEQETTEEQSSPTN
jgi:transcriptional regulator